MSERLAVVVHELRSPVAALVAIAEHMRRDPSGRYDLRELLTLATAACRGIERIVADAAMASTRPEQLEMGALAAAAVAVARLQGAPVRGEAEPNLPRIDGDEIRLRQALDNLIANAVEHTAPGSEVVVAVRGSGERVVVTVSDSGPGVSVVEQERIFEPGVRLDTGRPGSGLGLAIARAIADAHGGSLTVDSRPGDGARFTLALPVRAQPATRASTR
jgi:signal transduction histidine kinase